MNENKFISICESHQREYPTPLIGTMAFRHCELWCPFCGDAIGMFDGGKDVAWTEQLQSRHDKYKEKYSEYLHANAVTYASSIGWQGKSIPPSELPPEEKERLKNIRENGWKEGQKI